MKPLIGVTAYRRTFPKTGWLYDVSYARNAIAIQESGGLPVLVPSWLDEQDLRDIYDRLDGILLTGGEDIDPTNYNKPRHETVTTFDPKRDETEFALTRWAVADDKPILGICRGCQVMNVALGGTLHQDIPTFIDTKQRHDLHVPEEPRDQIMHNVLIQPETLLAHIMGGEKVAVNSIHHQCIDEPSPDVRVVAHSDDGIIEGIEVPGRQFALAIQWHPEDMTSLPHMKNLFDQFVNAAQARIRI
ncbi:MAG: gamma-glutamyl-gamma-aminobutyrate hydrolase family protein [Anaerolineaceae bacterium]|nr:gamma-glutamyl-gamma-aminobutyrate hydrolase family protein [Anaerolineaceae bacterium]